MLFSEVYGSYYKAVASVLECAVEGKLTGRKLTQIIQQKAFGESTLTIPEAMKDGSWALLDRDYNTPIRNKPTKPMTLLQKQWLKALLSDPRIKLFNPDTTGLEDIEPLYDRDTFVYFDRYEDGDPYNDECAANDAGIVYTGSGAYIYVIFTDVPFGVFEQNTPANPLIPLLEAMHNAQCSIISR